MTYIQILRAVKEASTIKFKYRLSHDGCANHFIATGDTRKEYTLELPMTHLSDQERQSLVDSCKEIIFKQTDSYYTIVIDLASVPGLFFDHVYHENDYADLFRTACEILSVEYTELLAYRSRLLKDLVDMNEVFEVLQWSEKYQVRYPKLKFEINWPYSHHRHEFTSHIFGNVTYLMDDVLSQLHKSLRDYLAVEVDKRFAENPAISFTNDIHPELRYNNTWSFYNFNVSDVMRPYQEMQYRHLLSQLQLELMNISAAMCSPSERLVQLERCRNSYQAYKYHKEFEKIGRETNGDVFAMYNRLKEEIANQEYSEIGAWIDAHGSAHLQKLYSAQCQDGVQALYKKERMELEYPEFVMADKDDIEWDQCDMPSEKALDMARQYAGSSVIVIKNEDEDEPIEAIKIPNPPFIPCNYLVYRVV